MDFESTFLNWRWWLVLPLAVLVLPFALVDIFAYHVIKPVWVRIGEWVHRREYV